MAILNADRRLATEVLAAVNHDDSYYLGVSDVERAAGVLAAHRETRTTFWCDKLREAARLAAHTALTPQIAESWRTFAAKLEDICDPSDT